MPVDSESPMEGATVDLLTPGRFSPSASGLDEADNSPSKVGEDEVKYRKPNYTFFSHRSLKRSATLLGLWAFGVNSVIGYDFVGWNRLACMGAGPLIIFTCLTSLLYLTLCATLAELSGMVPLAGAGYTYVRSVFGPMVGYIVGMFELAEYVLTYVVASELCAKTICDLFEWEVTHVNETIITIVLMIVAFFICVWGGQFFWRFNIFNCVVCVLSLVMLFIGAFFHANYSENAPKLASDPNAAKSDSFWAPTNDILSLAPLSIFMFLGMETIPLASEETRQDGGENEKLMVPKSLLRVFLTIVLITVGITFLIPSLDFRSEGGLCHVIDPFYSSLRIVFKHPESVHARKIFFVLAFFGQWARLPTSLFCAARVVFALSRSGYLVKEISFTHHVLKTPYISLGIVTLLSMSVFCVVRFSGTFGLTELFTLSSIFCALCVYALQSLAFIRLRSVAKFMGRPYTSPLGIPGAIFCFILSVGFVILILVRKRYDVVIVVGTWCILTVFYFHFFRKKRLVLSMDEDFALQIVIFNHRRSRSQSRSRTRSFLQIR